MTTLLRLRLFTAFVPVFPLLTAVPGWAAEVKPLRALLITGGCCHEYGKQKDVLKAGLEARANLEITQVHTDDTSTKARFEIYENPDWAKGYDVVIHDECSADVKGDAVCPEHRERPPARGGGRESALCDALLPDGHR
jgi:hypothetical protein